MAQPMEGQEECGRVVYTELCRYKNVRFLANSWSSAEAIRKYCYMWLVFLGFTASGLVIQILIFRFEPQLDSGFCPWSFNLTDLAP